MTVSTLATERRPLVLRTRPAVDLTDDEFFAFCRLNEEWRIERTAVGELEIMAPAGWETSSRNAIITAQLTTWALGDGTGIASDSSGGFILPNGAVRSPDAAWVRRDRLAALSAPRRERFLPLCPDFVIELRSPSDGLGRIRAKMAEYVENGARLGWLIDASEHRVEVCRPGVEIELLDAPRSVTGAPELSGFVMDLDLIWRQRS
ncbi:MAG TPA: Uma2 family endonuclease [Thermomicrobiales bacterium]|nr:Uma2 family endonuclease [Thermomicrobiales bacterium]